eukprot:TRINITY_DN1341_c4_g1_i1.p2 TRINITY_DN1341_c4_g1~~TRINITY_DN1341_c4_g1_i1.p2  ORF type:complete len:468 (+),score=176.13 TRINITY_DN1341_c4_g1_i1:72-1406(+)
MSTGTTGWSAGGMTGWRLDRNRIPWMKGFRATRRHVSVLSEELEAFDAFTFGSMVNVDAVVADVRSAVQSVCCTGTAAPSVASAAGIAVPQAPIEVDVSGIQSADEVSAMSCLLEAAGYTVQTLPCPPSAVAALQLQSPLGNAVVRVGDVDPVMTAALAAEARQCPEVKRVAQVLTHIIWQSTLLNSQGLSVDALVTMVAAVWRALPPNVPCDDAALLHATLSSYATQFDPNVCMVTLRGVRPLPPGAAPKLGLWVAHPCDPTANIASGCCTLPRIRNLFLHCSSALRRWDGPLTHPHGEHTRGKSPLASVIAFNKLVTAYPKPAQVPARKAEPGTPEGELSPRCCRRSSGASSSGSISAVGTDGTDGGSSGAGPEEEEEDGDLPPLLCDDGDLGSEPELDVDAAAQRGEKLNPLAQPFQPQPKHGRPTRRGARGKGRGVRGKA